MKYYFSQSRYWDDKYDNGDGAGTVFEDGKHVKLPKYKKRLLKRLIERNGQFVSHENFTKPWTDTDLYEKYGLTNEEIAFIEATIKPME